MFKCWDCSYSQISKGTLTPGGNQQYVVTCKQENVTFEMIWNASVSDLPCWEVKK